MHPTRLTLGIAVALAVTGASGTVVLSAPSSAAARASSTAASAAIATGPR